MKAELITKNKHLATRLPSKGSSLIEIIIALAVLALSIGAVILLVFANQNLKVDALTNNEALGKAKQLLEDARAKSRADFSTVVSIPPSTPGGDIYTTSVDVTDIDAFTKKVTSNVTWNESASRPIAIKLSTILTDPQSALGGDTCNQTLSGDWTNPQLLGTADVGKNNGGTDVDVFNKKAYITANASSGNKPDFYIVDVSNPNLSNLPVLGSINTGPGLAAVKVVGKYAYVANMSRTAQLQIIDISNPNLPFVAKSFKLTNVTGSGSQALGNSIFYLNKKVYLGLTKTATGPEFNVIDVSAFLTDPANSPLLIGSWAAGTSVNDITVKNNIAYIATPWPSSSPPTQENLSLLDVSNPQAGIARINTFSAPDPSTMSGKSVYISKDGKTLYLGRGGLNGAHNPEFFSLDVSNSNSIGIINSKYIPTANDITVSAVVIRSNLAFMWTSDPSLGFQIWDLNNLGSALPYASLNTQQKATGGFDCEGNFLYTAQASNKALQIIGPGP